MNTSNHGTQLCRNVWRNGIESTDKNGNLQFIRVANIKLCSHPYCTFAHDDISNVSECRKGLDCDERLCMYRHDNDVLVRGCDQHSEIRYFKKNGEVSEKIFNEDGEVITNRNYGESFPKKVAVQVPKATLLSAKGWGAVAETAAKEDALAKFKKAEEEAQKAKTALQNSLKNMEDRSKQLNEQIANLQKERETLDKKMQEFREELEKK